MFCVCYHVLRFSLIHIRHPAIIVCHKKSLKSFPFSIIVDHYYLRSSNKIRWPQQISTKNIEILALIVSGRCSPKTWKWEKQETESTREKKTKTQSQVRWTWLYLTLFTPFITCDDTASSGTHVKLKFSENAKRATIKCVNEWIVHRLCRIITIFFFFIRDERYVGNNGPLTGGSGHWRMRKILDFIAGNTRVLESTFGGNLNRLQCGWVACAINADGQRNGMHEFDPCTRGTTRPWNFIIFARKHGHLNGYAVDGVTIAAKHHDLCDRVAPTSVYHYSSGEEGYIYSEMHATEKENTRASDCSAPTETARDSRQWNQLVLFSRHFCFYLLPILAILSFVVVHSIYGQSARESFRINDDQIELVWLFIGLSGVFLNSQFTNVKELLFFSVFHFDAAICGCRRQCRQT